MSLRERLASGGFAVTAEISPPRGASTDPITKLAGYLRDWVDAVNITDNQGSNVRLSSWAGSLAAMAAGLEPVMQMTCRDRNRIALQSDLLGASALGIRNILVMTGDHPKFGDHPGAKPVEEDAVACLAGNYPAGDREGAKEPHTETRHCSLRKQIQDQGKLPSEHSIGT